MEIVLKKVKKIFSNTSSRPGVNIYWPIIIIGMLTIVFLLVGCSGVIFYPYGPEWSPDGSKIVFIKNYDIWVMNTDGSNQTRLTGIK